MSSSQSSSSSQYSDGSEVSNWSLYTKELGTGAIQRQWKSSDDPSIEDGSRMSLNDEAVEDSPQNWTTNIGELPSELLISIFLHAYMRGSDQIALSLSICQVCRFWRSIALTVPTLWSKIDILKDIKLTKQFLNRSNLAPLDMHICLRPTVSKQEGKFRIEHICSLVIPHHQRLRSIIFHAYYTSWFRASMDLLGNTGFDIHLHSLDVRLLQLWGGGDTDVLECNGLVNRFAIQPTHFRSEGFPVSNTRFFTPALRSMDVRWQQRVEDFWRASGIVELLFQPSPCVNLEYLRLTHAIHSGWQTPHQKPNIYMPHLREIIFEGIIGEAIGWFFTCAHTPGLQKLLIDFGGLSEEIRDPEWLGLTLATKKNPHLKHLHLKSCASAPRPKIIEALWHLPSLTDLRLTFCDTGETILRVLAYTWNCKFETNYTVCPQLSSITLEDDMYIPHKALINIVESRLNQGEGISPIKSLVCRRLEGPQFDPVELVRSLQDQVPELVVEIVEVADRMTMEVDEDGIEEEWIGSDEWLEQDSGDEELTATTVPPELYTLVME